jgi:hypothetical protein
VVGAGRPQRVGENTVDFEYSSTYGTVEKQMAGKSNFAAVDRK